MSSLAPAGVSSFHSRGGGWRRARGELRAARLRFVHCGFRTRAGPWRPRPSGRFREGPAARIPGLRPTRLRPWRQTSPAHARGGPERRPRSGRGVGARAPASPATGGPREEGARGGPAFPPEEAPGGHIAELSAVAAARLLSSVPGLGPPPLRSLAASRDAPAEPLLSQTAAGREGATHFRGKPCSARSLRGPPGPPPPHPARPQLAALRWRPEVARLWRRGPGLGAPPRRARAWPPERRRGR